MPYHCNLAQRFRDTVAAHADRPAIRRPEGGGCTFQEIDRLSELLARRLLERGLAKGDVVALFHDKSPRAYAAMLACLKIGAIYTNLDPDSPWERLRKMFACCEPALVLSFFAERPHARELAASGVPVLEMPASREAGEIGESAATAEPQPPVDSSGVTGADPAYIMFTSGSTGTPKGAVMSHANVLNFIDWARDRLAIVPADIFSNANPIFFDNSVFDFYASIFNGASLVPITTAEARDPRAVVRVINETRCTIWFSVPSLLVYLLTTRALSAGDFPAVRNIIFGGEGFPKPKLKQLFDLFGDRIGLENVYGPTECTCICSAYTVTRGDFDDMQSLAPLGYLAPNFDYEIIAPEGGDPDGGELFLRGPNVGLGYYNNPEGTAAVFRQNPAHARYRDIGYCTGDLVRRDAEGRLHFRGRADFQIKHMGYRIELEEIEAGLATLPGVHECAAIYRRLGGGMGQILGYVGAPGELDEAELIAQISRLLPAYMVPKRIHVLAALPKNANGKIDRKALLEGDAPALTKSTS